METAPAELGRAGPIGASVKKVQLFTSPFLPQILSSHMDPLLISEMPHWPLHMPCFCLDHPPPTQQKGL